MSDLPSLMPPNVLGIERDFEQLTKRLKGLSLPIEVLWNPDLCPVNLLPYLAWAMSVEDWDDRWSAEQKRATIKSSVAVHRVKGTRGAVERSLSALGFRIDLTEWFDTGDPVHTFRLDAYLCEPIGPTETAFDDALKRVESSLDTSKPVRSHPFCRVGFAGGMAMRIGHASRVGLRITGNARSCRAPHGFTAPVNLATAMAAAIRLTGAAFAVRSGLEG